MSSPQIPPAVKAALRMLGKHHGAALHNLTKRQRPPFEQHNVNSGPHPAVIFGAVAVTMLVVFAAAVVLGRRRMKKRQQAHRNRYSALVSEGGANANRNTVVQNDGYGQGTFPGYAYDGGEGGYKYTAGYAGGPDVPPPAYTSHDTGSGSGGAADNGVSTSGGGEATASTSGGGGATVSSS